MASICKIFFEDLPLVVDFRILDKPKDIPIRCDAAVSTVTLNP